MLFSSPEPAHSKKSMWRKAVFSKGEKGGHCLFYAFDINIHVFSQCVALPTFYKMKFILTYAFPLGNNYL